MPRLNKLGVMSPGQKYVAARRTRRNDYCNKPQSWPRNFAFSVELCQVKCVLIALCLPIRECQETRAGTGISGGFFNSVL